MGAYGDGMTEMTQRPALGKVAPGDTMYVIMPHTRHGSNEPIEAVVTSVTRVYVTITESGPPPRLGRLREWRMRLDTQAEHYYPNKASGSRVARFVTPAQLAYDWKVTAASAYLLAQGIDVRRESPWRGREVELAEVLRAAQ